MATNTPPPPKKKSTKGEPPQVQESRSNLNKPEPGKLVDLNFKVPAEFRKDFKVAAAIYGKTQVDLLQEIFEFWSKSHG
ncbi:MAG: hypothetical protein HC930_01570 [Hydrococcus sp. SU_1_0]|nr:hypothetical protein [Hydrococcus sp. SU_1_0]